jgi:hypothetical protein
VKIWLVTHDVTLDQEIAGDGYVTLHIDSAHVREDDAIMAADGSGGPRLVPTGWITDAGGFADPEQPLTQDDDGIWYGKLADGSWATVMPIEVNGA